LQFEKSFVVILVLAIATTIISQIGCATLSINVPPIPAKGTIGSSQIVASSGSARDIQDALNIAAAQGITKVVIPEGTFDFATGSWQTVNIPSGVSLFGAPTQRDPNGQVVEWQTILRMPFDAPEKSMWFSVQGASDVRVSDIKMVGYREIDSNNKKHYRGFDIRNSANFRIDHCYLRNICGEGILIKSSNGVVDHSRFVNNPAYVHAYYSECTVWYAIAPSGDGVTWETNIQDVLGYYTSRSVFIEDNYFEGWRHTVASNLGAHYVYRYNTERKNGYGTVDAHGHEPYLSTRCIEVYDNDFGGPVWGDFAVQLRGGGGVFFNNKVDGYGTQTSPADYTAFVCMIQYTPNAYPDEQVKDVWIWNNSLTPAGADLWDAGWGSNNPIYENEHFFLRAPDQTLDGFEYTPYQYPHPLATE